MPMHGRIATKPVRFKFQMNLHRSRAYDGPMLGRRELILACGAAGLVAALPPRLAWADDGEGISPTLEVFGSWRYVGGSAQREAVEAAVDEVVAQMAYLIQGIAKRRLMASNNVPALLSISRDGDDIVVLQPGIRSVRAPANGTQVQWKSEQGDKVQVSHHLDSANKLRQEFRGEGDRTNTFTLSEDGTRLTWKTAISAKRLPSDIRYKLSYARVQS